MKAIRMYEDKDHKCSACLKDFEPNAFGFLKVNRCPKFVGARMDLSDKKELTNLWLEDIDVNEAKLADLKLPDGLKQLSFSYMSIVNFADLKLPDELEKLNCYNLPELILFSGYDSSLIVNFANLKLPDGLKELSCCRIKNANFSDLKLPNGLKFLLIDGANVKEVLIQNGYYEEKYLMQDDEETTIINSHSLIKYKRRCINLNWLLGNLDWWDWHLNIVIDNYCGFRIN